MKRMRGENGGDSAFTLVEVIMSISVAAITIGGIIAGYTMSARWAEWSSYSLAAYSLAMQKLEQTRAAKWDPQGFPAVDELVSSNFPVQFDVMDIPVSGTNVVYATNTTTITTLSASPDLKMIRVDCTWMFMSRGPFTNTVMTYRTADQ